MKFEKEKLSLEEGLKKEWLITNGIGGYSSSTILGANTRKYHGLLVAPLMPPGNRQVILSKLDESIEIEGKNYNLYTNVCKDFISDGYKNLVSFEKEYIPIFTYQVEDVSIKKFICMEHGKNTVSVFYYIKNGEKKSKLTLAPVVNFRGFHTTNNSEDFQLKQEIENNKNNIKEKTEQIEEIKQDNFNLEESIKEILEKIENIKETVKNSGSKIEELKKERLEKSDILSKQEEQITEKFNIIEDLKAQLVKLDVKKTKIQEDINSIINKMWEEYELTPNAVKDYEKPNNISATQKEVNRLRNEIKEIGSVNIDSIEEYKNLKDRYDFMSEQRLDLETTMNKLRKIISEMTQIMKEQFKEKFKVINKNFDEVFKELFGGGKAELKLEDEEKILECDIEITAQPPGKKLQSMTLLSGGEKALTAIALLFAILKINPAPFCVLDEIEAALDDVNVYRYAEYLKKFAKDTQFLVITHRKGTMEVADTVYGVTMEENGISKLLSMKLK